VRTLGSLEVSNAKVNEKAAEPQIVVDTASEDDVLA
jgi:hypothetical protein